MKDNWISILASIVYILGLFAHTIYSRRQGKKLDRVMRWIRSKDYKNVNVYAYDDDPQELEFIERNALSKIENNHQVFIDQISVLEKAKTGINVFVIDHFGFGMSGVEFTRKIKEANPKNWVISYTGAEDVDTFAEYANISKEYRIDRFVSKNGKDAERNLIKAINEGIILISNL